ncbi:MAG: MerR family transcriptional regulator [Spirochaetes bacterium]|nr:MerR family transcriptional regulator [Spirochaetota bacterium]
MENKSKHTFSEPVYTIGIAAKKVGLSVHTLRLYEAEGLIITYKTETGRRLYSDLEIEKIVCIRSMIHQDGLNFEGIRRILGLVPCWKLRKCNSGRGTKCRAYQMRTRPCWSSGEKCIAPYPSCRDCPVYQGLVHCSDVEKLVYS